MSDKNLTEKYYRYNNPLVPIREYFSLRARAKMHYKFLESMNPGKDSQILDLGATPDTILKDSNYLEKNYAYPNNITVTSIEDCSNLVKEYGLKGFVLNQSGKPLPFEDNTFDILFCAATLEHVGNRENQRAFIQECLRCARSVFITTPNRFFPIEMHTFLPFVHWLPWSWFQRIVGKLIGPFYASIDNLNLLSSRDLLDIIPKRECAYRIDYIRTLGFKSNLILVLKKQILLNK